jgi:dipeptidyl aminopeptidase/acylaminoacyl peptidase
MNALSRHCGSLVLVSFAGLLAAAFVEPLAGSAAAPAPAVARPMEIDDLFRIRRVSDPQISPDGRSIAYVITEVDKAENKSNSDLWIVAAGGGAARKLTASPKHDRHPRWSPDGRWIAFESNRDGAFQIWVLPSDGGEARPLTSIATEATTPVWSPDGRHVAFVSAVFPEFSERPYAESNAANKKRLEEREQSKVKARVITQLLYRHWDSWVDDKRQHLFVLPVRDGTAEGEPRDLTPGDRDAVPTSTTFSAGDDFAFSADGTELAYTATPVPTREEAWNTNHDVYTVNVGSGERRQITTNTAADGFPRYSPDGKWIAYRAQARAGFEADRWQLMLHERASGRTRSVTAEFDSWVEGFVWAPDSRSLYFEAERRGHKLAWAVAIDGGTPRPCTTRGTCADLGVSPDGRHLIFTHAGYTRAAEVACVPAAGGELEPITRTNDELFRALQLSEPQPVEVAGADGARVQMWIVRPPGFDERKRWPLVFWVHGGPQGAFTDSWSYRWNPQLWAARGYVLALPNPRGSTGFGQVFVDQISHDWGGRVFGDLMAALGWLEGQPWVDTNRMAAAGASYGGYIMNWFQGHMDKFKTLVTHCGVYNFYSMYGTTEELWFDEWEHGVPWETPDFDRQSPHRFAGRFKTPNLIIHNELDFRVPIGEGLALFTTLQRKGVPSKLLYFPDEGHWVLKPLNSELWHKTIFDWLATYLR